MSKYTLIAEYLQGFEKTLDTDHEIALKFPDYGGPFVLLSTRAGKDDFIAFELLSESGEFFTVIQDCSHVNFAVFPKLKADLKKPPRRAGFVIDKQT